jgi:hypothetical protein
MFYAAVVIDNRPYFSPIRLAFWTVLLEEPMSLHISRIGLPLFRYLMMDWVFVTGKQICTIFGK